MSEKETKNQHYLPFVYLKYFRCNSEISSRKKATIFRDDGVNIMEERVVNQCYSKWTYKKENTSESEDSFQVFESDWDESISRARAGIEENALLFIQIIMYHFRNVSIQNSSTEKERFTFVNYSISNFIEQNILLLKKGVYFTDSPDHVHNFPWHVRIIKMDNPILLTSDNPAVLTITQPFDGSYGPFFLPISPTELLVAVDKQKYSFISYHGRDHDGYIANAFVAGQAMRHVYYNQKIPESIRTDLWSFIKRNKETSNYGSFNNDKMLPTHPIYAEHSSMTFQFLKKLSI